MTDPQPPPPPTDPPASGASGHQVELPHAVAPDEDAREQRGWSRRARVGTGLLVVLFGAIGLFAAWTVTPTPDEAELPRPADTDVVIAGGAPLSWDPAAISDSISAQVLAQLYEGLTVLDAESNVRPALAESWSVEDDGHRIVFELREGLAFSDGGPLTAEDVRRSWLRVIDPTSPSPLSSLLDVVTGAASYTRGEGSADEVGIVADGRTLTVDFDRPAAYFPAVAAVPSLAVVPPSIDSLARGPRDGVDFDASGAFVPVEQASDQIRLQANEHYWAGTAPMDRATVLTDEGGRSSVDIFEDEAVDWTRIADADASWIRYDRYLGPQLRHTEEMAVDMLGFDTATPPFDDPAVRRAVAMAVDWRGLAALDGSSDPAPTSIVPPGVVARSDGDYLLAYDPEAARGELAAAGYPGGSGFPAVSLVTYGVGPTEAIAADLRRELGIEVAVERRSFEDHSLMLDRDTPNMWTLAWSADFPHAHDFLGLLLRSDSSANIGGWTDAAYDDLVDAAAATADEAEQERLYAQAQDIVRESVPLIPLDYGQSWWLSREGLRGGLVSGVGVLRYADLEWGG